MNPQPDIRRMTLADLDAVVALERLSFTDPWPYSSWRGMFEDPHARVWVVATSVVEGTPEFVTPHTQKIIGALAVWLILDELHIGTIAVHPDYRRQGLGAVLLETGIRAGLAEGAKVVHLEVRKSNLSAQRLYERFGFKRVGERKRYYSDNREDAVLMSTPVGDEYLRWLDGDRSGTW